MTLPLFLSTENKWNAAWIWFFVATILYVTSNRFHLCDPRILPMGAIDLAIPFLPRTFWIYISEYLLFPAVYINCRDMVNANKYFYSFIAIQIISVLIFWAWPTTYPRDRFPLPENLDRFTTFAFSTFRNSDTPANCCPSLHVSSVYLSSFVFINEQRKKLPFFFLWATAISISTLTTKQHYLIDVMTGLLMAVVTYWFFYKKVSYVPMTELRWAKR